MSGCHMATTNRADSRGRAFVRSAKRPIGIDRRNTRGKTMARPKGQKKPLRPTVLDTLGVNPARNIYCRVEDLTNEASVETFFLSRLLQDLGYKDSQIKTKESIDRLTVAQGHQKKRYKPDYVLLAEEFPRCVIDAKGP